MQQLLELELVYGCGLCGCHAKQSGSSSTPSAYNLKNRAYLEIHVPRLLQGDVPHHELLGHACTPPHTAKLLLCKIPSDSLSQYSGQFSSTHRNGRQRNRKQVYEVQWLPSGLAIGLIAHYNQAFAKNKDYVVRQHL